ncbi:hypothetical protein JXA88_07325 [Candidatus Fermentibacteria bacterium]|nr:hypothetical protein [Candidatus Fermentibacteria bacterium]
MNMMRATKLAAALLLLGAVAFAKVDERGKNEARRKNWHSGNLVHTTYFNYGMIGRELPVVPGEVGGEWPINSGHWYVGDVSVLVGAELVDIHGDTVFSVQVSDGPRGFNEYSPDGSTFWGWEPIPGYSRDVTGQEGCCVAMSHQPESWPAFWPDKMGDANDPGWPAQWNGYFGKNVKNADQESYWLMDDASDQEFAFYPDATDSTRRGLGLRVAVRGMQWSHVLAEDCIFWVYDITNIGTTDYDKVVFGMIVGGMVGGGNDANDDHADFDKIDNITYCWDHDNVGETGFSPVGYVGYAFLESPGNPYDGIDNDNDGAFGSGITLTRSQFGTKIHRVGDPVVLIDYGTYERTVTTMPAEGITFTYRGTEFHVMPNVEIREIERNNIDDNLDGLIDENNGFEVAGITYYLNEGYKAKNWITGAGLDNLLIDERRDDGIDNDGDWDPLTDDVGLDGVPGTGDYGEGDGLPTSGAGTDLPGEPNIDKTDIDESDQIGLTSFYFFYPSGGLKLKNDDDLWDAMAPGYFNATAQNVDGDFVYGSGYFPLKAGQTERISVCLVFGDDRDDIIRNKRTVQTIYNQNYNFAKAPDLPKLTAVPGDKKITLFWDDTSERSFDVISGYDFEGYKIYKATDTEWGDADDITDAWGSPKFDKPIAIYDIQNGIKGLFPLVDERLGAQFDLGSDSGLRHSFVDTQVVNGQRYFYAVTAYDRGDVAKELTPAETSKFVKLNADGSVSAGINVGYATPNPMAAGYEPPTGSGELSRQGTAHGTGTAYLEILDPDDVPESGLDCIVTFVDQSCDTLDNDGDWIAWDDEPNGTWDTGEPFLDVGTDGKPSTQEVSADGRPYNPVTNPDPAGDNYDAFHNPGGTEGNDKWDFTDINGNGMFDPGFERAEPWTDLGDGVLDPGEEIIHDTGTDGLKPGDAGYPGPDADGTEGNGIPDPGEPNVDHRDPDELLPLTTGFWVYDRISGKYLVNGVRDFVGDSHYFRLDDQVLGMRLRFENDSLVTKVDNLTGWSVVRPNNYVFTVEPFKAAGIAEIGVAFPRDYLITFLDETSESSSVLTITVPSGPQTLPARACNFRLTDAQTGDRLPFAYIDVNLIPSLHDPGFITGSDQLVFFEPTPEGRLLTWKILFIGSDSTSHVPVGGDELLFSTTKPFSATDEFVFSVEPQNVNTAALGKSALDDIMVVPNPYIAAASWEGKNPYTDGRGPRELHFVNLPSVCTIRIYTISGALVNTIEHDSLTGTAVWDMLTKDNLDIAYGVYIYHVDAPGIGEKIGKFAVIK